MARLSLAATALALVCVAREELEVSTSDSLTPSLEAPSNWGGGIAVRPLHAADSTP